MGLVCTIGQIRHLTLLTVNIIRVFPQDVLVQCLCLVKEVCRLVQPCQIICGCHQDGTVVGFIITGLFAGVLQ